MHLSFWVDAVAMPTFDVLSSDASLPEDVALAVELFGDKSKTVIIRYLNSVGRASYSDIVQATGIERGALGTLLMGLEQASVVSLAIDHDGRPGNVASYGVDRRRVERLAYQHLLYLFGGNA